MSHRPELHELRTTVKALKRDSEMRLTLDVEAQQSFDFLSDQLHGLRRAFGTLSDVLVDEADSLRADAAERHAEAHRAAAHSAKALKTIRSDAAAARAECEAAAHRAVSRADEVGAAHDGLREDMRLLALEVGKSTSAQHLLALEMAELRSAMDEERREARARNEQQARRLADMSDELKAGLSMAKEAVATLHDETAALKHHAEAALEAHAAAIEANRAKLLQCAQALENQWTASKAATTKLDSVERASQLSLKELHERLDALVKQHSRGRAQSEEMLKAVNADLQLLQAHARQIEAALDGARAEARRLVQEHQAEMQRQCDTLGRAIHSLAETLNLTTPLLRGGGGKR